MSKGRLKPYRVPVDHVEMAPGNYGIEFSSLGLHLKARQRKGYLEVAGMYVRGEVVTTSNMEGYASSLNTEAPSGFTSNTSN